MWYIIKNADLFNFEAPTFSEGATIKYKIVDGSRLVNELQYQFKYPNPLEFDYSRVLKPSPPADDPRETPDIQ